MTTFAFILSSARHYGRAHLGLLFGAFLASAILSGSLLVGDSVKASLRRVAELRLGKIHAGMIGGDRWVTEKLAHETKSVPMIIASGSVSVATRSTRAAAARVNGAQVLGVDDAFWQLSPSGKVVSINTGELAINAPMARRLQVAVGDTVIVRLEKPSAISRDAPMSGATDQDVALRRKVSAVIRDDDFGAFQLAASAVPQPTAFLALADLQIQVEMEGKCNAVMSSEFSVLGAQLQQKATMEDFGLKLERVKSDKAEWQIGTDRIFMDEGLTSKLLAHFKDSYGLLTYLVNGLSSASGKTPYSMITAAPSARFAESGSKPSLVINSWLAEDQGLKVGDKVDLRYFVMGLGRQLTEQTTSFTVSGILPITDARLTKDWTPHFPGLTDTDNCRDWNTGMPMDLSAMRDKDQEYWTQHRGTPKAFIDLTKGQELWGNRFGKLTGIRFADSGQDEAQLKQEIASILKLADIGLSVRDFKADANAAAKGSVDFGGLFVGLSMFLIAAALVFAALLFVFMIERRASQVGLLMAIGWTAKQVRGALLGEAGVIALVGSGLGLIGGVFYTKAALAGLNGVWGSATAGLQITYAAQPLTRIIAGVSSFVVSMLTLWWVTRKLLKTAPRALLAGEGMQITQTKRERRWTNWKLWSVIGFIMAIGLGFAGTKATNAEELGGMFFGAGMLLMVAMLALASGWMKAMARGQRVALSLTQIGVRNVVRRPGRSLAVLGMMAGGIFLVAAVNAFRLSADADATKRDSGTGGFALIGESSLSVYEDLNAKAGREAFGLDAEDMEGVAVVPFRVRPGDDASCLNLNKAQNPQVVGVKSDELAKRKAFVFSGKGSWDMLTSSNDDAVPAIADMATAMWGLGKGVGDVLDYDVGGGKTMRVKIAALLAGSVLQGKIIIDEKAFIHWMPDTAGYRFFLIDATAKREREANETLMKQLEPRGLALERTVDRLNAFSAVQNAYIGIFTVLGGLGVLLGTAGIGVLVARHVLERRGELGLMQAMGFLPSRLRTMIIGEHGALILGGVVCGVLSAALAVWPSLQQSSQDLPLSFMLKLVAAIVVFGLIVCVIATSTALRGRLTESIRKE
ncbi:MAG: ABC transporter permease [Verrucomicrobiaceae bacterium]|nr:ABC transporter permease [Verrucomicrobiaceae bacterium]